MKKKILLLLVVIALCVTLAFSAFACKKPAGEISISEYKQILEQALTYFANKYDIDNSEENSTLALLSAESAELTYPKQIFDILDASTEKTALDPENSFWDGVAIGLADVLAYTALMDILAYCETAEEIYGLKDLYGVTLNQLADTDESGNRISNDKYITVVSSGNHKIAYLYGGKAGRLAECFYVYDIEFIDGKNFSVTMTALAEIDGQVQGQYYAYTDTDGRFLYITESGAIFNIGEVCYSIEDGETMQAYSALVQAKYDAVDLKFMRAFEGKQDYSFTYEQYEKNRDAIQEKY